MDAKVEQMLGRIGDPNRSWFRHKATGKIRDATDDGIARYEAMCEKPAIWQKLTAEKAEAELIAAIRGDAQMRVDAARPVESEAEPEAASPDS